MFGKGRQNVTSASVRTVRLDLRADGLIEGGVRSLSMSGGLLGTTAAAW